VDTLLTQIFSSNGSLVNSCKNFEERPGQQDMARQILHAYIQKKIAILEAGTGTGKSLAYLIPAILWAIKQKEKTVISTYTIALQEQLLVKDIPMLFKALQVDLKAVIVKGMNNYLCLRKLKEMNEDREIEALHKWSEHTQEGSYSDFTFPLTASSWDKVKADSQNCSHIHCPHYQECFFFKARRLTEEAHLLIVNHHILFADKAIKKQKDYREERAIIPSYKRLIIDEAHHLEEVALDALSKRFDRQNLMRLIGRIYSELYPESSCLTLIRQAIHKVTPSLMARLEIELPAEKRELADRIEKAFYGLEAFCRTTFFSKEARWRLRLQHFQNPFLQREVIPLFDELVYSLKKFAQSLQGLKEEIEKALPQYALELQAVTLRLEEQAEGLEAFFVGVENATRVRWVEASSTGNNLILVDAQLDVSSYLKEEFFTPLSTLVLCSATLSSSGHFHHLRERLGVSQELSISEHIYDSPFDYASNALLAVPFDLPDPGDSLFIKEASHFIFEAISASNGGAFILFTSYEMLRHVYQQLAPLAEKKGFHFLKQGDASRQLLIEEFKKKKRAVLFGADSFWEGVDIIGDALRLVILTKLPFRVPTDPLTQALSEIVEKSGKNSFMDYQVPQAIIKFKQGFGRLIRSKTDKGCTLCLDKRLITKSYGKLFLQSLPACKTLFAKNEEVLNHMKGMWSQ